MLRAVDLRISPLDVPLLAPFGIATGAQHIAHNVLVQLVTTDGLCGYGEAAPVEHISGETQGQVMEGLRAVLPLLAQADLRNYRPLCRQLAEALKSVPSALAAIEMAIFDAICKSYGISLLQFFGAAEQQLHTDITITTGSREESQRSVARYLTLGFTRLKVKIGGAPLQDDVDRLLAIHQTAPGAHLILDGNTAFTSESAVELVEALGPARARVILFEQPVPRDDFEGLARVEALTNIKVAADESLRSIEDFRNILKVGGISAINIKTAKLGLLLAWDLYVAAKRAGLRVMVGGMVETELSMTASACLAAGVGGCDYVDLDTPLLLGPRPLRGGFEQVGPLLNLRALSQGHGVLPLSAET